MIVAILGTTISPYLFFWQATMEAEDQEHNKTQIVVDKQDSPEYDGRCKYRHVCFQPGNVVYHTYHRCCSF